MKKIWLLHLSFPIYHGAMDRRQNAWNLVRNKQEKTGRKIWVALATAQNKVGLVTKRELQDITKHQEDIEYDREHQEIEKEDLPWCHGRNKDILGAMRK